MDFPEPDFRALFGAAPGLNLVLSPDLRIVAVTDAYLRATMTTREAILGRGIFEAFPDNPNDPEATGVNNLRASLNSVLESGRADTMAVQKYDVRRPDAEGGGFEERYWSPRNYPVPGPDGRLQFIIHRVEDVTEFVRLKQAGREREESTTKALQEMEAEVYLRAQEVAAANRSLQTANATLGRLYHQISLLLSHASELHVEAGAADEWDLLCNPLTPEEMLARVSRMIADYQRMEEQLRQSQKMEAVGRLAGGVAHDFNNLLTVIAGYTALLKDDLGPGEQPELDEIHAAVTRAAELTRQLLTFSRKQVCQPQVLEINTVVSRMEGMLRRLIGEDIVLVSALAGDLGRVKADPGQIEQVIMNLAVNARDAMPDGGKLLIETKAVQLEAGQIAALAAGHYVQIAVSDTGHGMSAETASRIFEPFFTTKEVGKGTGLGLSTALGVVEQTGGSLTVESRLGAGTTFRAYLPVTAEQAAGETGARAADSAGSGSATILLVEDETPLRKLISQVLKSAGHTVLEAASGDEAFAISTRHPGAIDLLLTDVIMPGMSGPELVAKLRIRRPNTAIVFMSGYDHDLLDKKSVAFPASFLPKPFSPRALLRRIDALLGFGAEGDERVGRAGD
ncbi:MAG TPA: ATP-binding protein [Bryobacteraceae bacterium]|jgi:signal transduction histidine kinase|nr:ATP-binding protein [Bryobacteraceae bacterium]